MHRIPFENKWNGLFHFVCTPSLHSNNAQNLKWGFQTHCVLKRSSGQYFGSVSKQEMERCYRLCCWSLSDWSVLLMKCGVKHTNQLGSNWHRYESSAKWNRLLKYSRNGHLSGNWSSRDSDILLKLQFPSSITKWCARMAQLHYPATSENPVLPFSPKHPDKLNIRTFI